ncbi:MAG: alpha/beta hydrolase-fold protein [Polyangiaceae bacterium]
MGSREGTWVALGGTLLAVLAVQGGCGGDADTTSGSGAGGSSSSAGGSATSAGGSDGGASGGTGGAGGVVEEPITVEDLLTRLRADLDGTLLEESRRDGWPVLAEEGHVVVSVEPSLPMVAGDFDGWAGTTLAVDQGFRYAVIDASTAAGGYKFTDGATYVADPWARAYVYDSFGELSLIAPTDAHLERHFEVGDVDTLPRRVRVWHPGGQPSHVLYVQDGQNLFDPDAPFGGWHLQDVAPAGMMLVGIDNTSDRFDEYTPVPDVIGGNLVGGEADDYAAFLHDEVRPLIAEHYGEPAKVGVMGSSLGGLVSLFIAHEASDYVFAASLSGTLGWGSIGTNNLTLIEDFAQSPSPTFTIYLDAGGGGTCVDSDMDGIEDDAPDGADNYCENRQMRDTLLGLGMQQGVDLFFVHEPGAPHNEAAWAARVATPMTIFAGL